MSYHFMRLLLLIQLTLLMLGSSAQNLVPNGSMEDENICTEYLKNCAPEAWIVSSLQSNFYFDDPAAAYHGQRFVGLPAGVNMRYGSRNFIRTPLLCGLRSGAEYRVEFYIRNGSATLDSAGVYFSTDDLLYRRAGLKNVHPSLWVGSSTTSTNNKDWIKFSAVYRAEGDEAFIHIALFKTTAAARVSRIATNVEFYFYVDAVSVVPLNTAERLCADAEKRKGEIYEENERHLVIEKKIYQRQRQEPVPVYLTKTIVQKIDTLVIPDVLFATNSYALTKAAVLLLDSFAASITNKPDSIIVHGHTDNQGSKSLNVKLSSNRAASVAAHLGRRFTAKEIIFCKRGWADEKPRADNSTPAGRQQNRRVEIFVYKAD